MPKTTYDDMLELIFAKGNLVGYLNVREKVYFAYCPDTERIYLLNDHGYFWSGLNADNEEHAVQVIKNNPHFNYEITHTDIKNADILTILSNRGI